MIRDSFSSHIKKIFMILACASLLSFGCASNKEITIAISKGSGSEHYTKYNDWIKGGNQDIKIIDLYKMSFQDAIKAMDTCSGLVLSGGPDVHPDRYGRASDTAMCQIDLRRDTLEFSLIEIAMRKKVPILAICRGEQIFNVAFGGSLYVDIPTELKSKIAHRCDNPDSCFHAVKIDTTSLLYYVCQVNGGEVNTNHHQGVDKLANPFKASAFSEDGLIEAYEWKVPSGLPPFLAVQWHPERLPLKSSLSGPILKYFLNEVDIYSKTIRLAKSDK